MKELVKIKINPKDINFFNRIMEGYEYLGMVSTLDKQEGIVIVRTTPDTYDEVRKILDHLPLEQLEYVEVN
jgi:putative protease